MRRRTIATKSPDKIPPGSELDALTAQKVFGWKNVHKHDGVLVGKKQDKAGRWRTARYQGIQQTQLRGVMPQS